MCVFVGLQTVCTICLNDKFNMGCAHCSYIWCGLLNKIEDTKTWNISSLKYAMLACSLIDFQGDV